MYKNMSKFYDRNYYVRSTTYMKNVCKNKRIILFGASTRIKQLLELIEMPVCYICDNDSKKWNTEIYGIDVVSPKVLENEKKEDIIVLTVLKCYRELSKQLSEFGILNYYFFSKLDDKYLNMFIHDKVFEKSNNIIQMNIKKIKYIHFFPDIRFIKDFLHMIEEEFDISQHFFIVHNTNSTNKNDQYCLWDCYKKYNKKYNNIYVLDDNENLNNVNNYIFLEKIKNIIICSDKIILHSAFMVGATIEFLGNIINTVKEKTIWIIWGYDAYLSSSDIIVKNVLRYVKRINSGGKREYKNVINNYHMIDCKHYNYEITYNYFDNYEFKSINNEMNETINIMVGHSASKIGNHLKAFEILMKFKENNIKVYCPLSYNGDKKYIDEVMRYGNETFGTKFIPILDYMDKVSYINFLNEIDIALFPADIRMGVHNIYILLYLKKKVYIKNVEGIWDYFKERDYNMNDLYDIPNQDFYSFVYNKDKEKNYDEVQKIINYNLVAQNWNNLFEFNENYVID